MLTPVFEINQDETYLIIVIKAPFAKVSEVETFVEGNEFKFYSKPYFLRLTLPGRLVEDGREVASYDTDSGVFTIQVPKEKAGEKFDGLDMLTKLLAPKGQVSAKPPLIEVLDDKDEGATARESQDEEEEDFDWCIEQEPCVEGEVTLDGPKYGFANLRSGVFSRLKSELGLIVDLEEPDTTPAPERQKLRSAKEDDKFDDDHYLADLYGDDVIQELLRFTPPWCEESLSQDDNLHNVTFSDVEKDQLRKLPNKEYLLEEKTQTSVFLSLVDIMFAYCYDLRTTEGESTVESAWNICKLSSTLSWLDRFASLHEVLVACYRRCLCFPLYRHWNLTQAVFQDLAKLFSSGKRQLLKNLLQIHSLLQESDPYYVLNDLYITDYCVWIQSASEKRLESLAFAISKMEMKKEDLGFHLDELETAAESLIMESEMDSVSENLSKLSVAQPSENTRQSMSRTTYKNGANSGTLPDRDSDDDSTDTDDVSTIGNDESTESDDEASSSDYTSNLVNARNSARYIKEINTQAHV